MAAKETKCIENEHGIACKWESNIVGRVFYTIEFDNSAYLDFYEDEEKWMEAFKSGVNNNARIESIPNVFRNDETENTFFVLFAIYEANGNLRVAFDTMFGIFDMDNEGYLKPNYETCGIETL